MQTLSELKLLPVWVDAQHLALSAKLLMQGHALRIIPVTHLQEVVGMVELEDLKDASEGSRVHEYMKAPHQVLDGSTTVVRAAQLFVDKELDYAPVVHGNQLLGIVTTHHLLRELRRTWDPLTSLGWSDRLREWGGDQLRSGNEISILFIDIDHFGLYNKRHGHIIGDKVLIQFAKMLSESIDPERDVLVRYGGDEFAIGTLRNHNAALELAKAIREAGSHLILAEENRPIGFTMGLSGGRRTEIREDVHISSTLDDLINLASKDCLARKHAARSTAAPVAEAPAPAPAPVALAVPQPVITLAPSEPAPQAEPETKPFRPRFDPEA